MPAHENRRRLPLRFTLKSAIVLMTVTAIGCALFGYWLRSAKPLSPREQFEAWVSQTWFGFDHLRFSPDGKHLAVDTVRFLNPDHTTHRARNIRRTIAVVDVPTLSINGLVEGRLGQRHHVAGTHTPLRIAFTPDSHSLLVLMKPGDPLRCWDIESKTWSARDWIGDEALYSLNTSSNGQRLLLRTVDHRELIDLANAEAQRSTSDKGPFMGPSVFSGQGDFSAVHKGGAIEVWDVERMLLLYSFSNSPPQSLDFILAISPDGNRVAAPSTGGVELYDTVAGSKKVLLPDFSTPAKRQIRTRGLEFSADGKVLAAWGNFGLKFFDAVSGAHIRTIQEQPFCLAFSPNGKTYATVELDGKLVIYDVATGEKLRSAVFGEDPDGSLTFINTN